MGLQRQVCRRYMRRHGLLSGGGQRHACVAVRVVNTSSTYRYLYFDSKACDFRWKMQRAETVERHYLHATKGWKVDRGTRHRRVVDVPSDSMPVRIVGIREARLPNPKRVASAS